MSQTNILSEEKIIDPSRKALCKAGGIAALIAGILLRRNIAAEISLVSGGSAPDTVADWFQLLQESRMTGLVSLNILDLVNYALVGLMFLTLYALLKQFSRNCMTIALASGLMGITVYFSSNTALSMLSLSNEYASAVSQAEKDLLLSAGEAMLAFMRFGTGGFVSLLLIAVSGMLISAVMLKSRLFGKAAPVTGMLASALDLLYCAAFVILPSVSNELLSVCFLPAAGLFLMIWHIMTGIRLLKLSISKRSADRQIVSFNRDSGQAGNVL